MSESICLAEMPGWRLVRFKGGALPVDVEINVDRDPGDEDVPRAIGEDGSITLRTWDPATMTPVWITVPRLRDPMR